MGYYRSLTRSARDMRSTPLGISHVTGTAHFHDYDRFLRPGWFGIFGGFYRDSIGVHGYQLSFLPLEQVW